MASGQSMAHVRLMGEIPLNAKSTVRIYGPSRANAPEVFLLSEARLSGKISRRKPERETRIPGLALASACPKARGLPEGTRRKPDTDGRANLFKGSRIAARRSERRDRIFLIWFAPSRG